MTLRVRNTMARCKGWKLQNTFLSFFQFLFFYFVVFLFGACVQTGERPAYTYELLGILKDYIPVLRSQAVDFYSSTPAALLESRGGIDAFGKVPIRGSNKCGGYQSTETCFSVAIGVEISQYPEEYQRLLVALRNPCATFAQNYSKSQLKLRGFKTENILTAAPLINSLRRIFGCDQNNRNEVTIYVEEYEGLDSGGLDLLGTERRPSVAIVPRKDLKLIRVLTIKAN